MDSKTERYDQKIRLKVIEKFEEWPELVWVAYYCLIKGEMAEAKFILYVRKFLRNPLLARKQVVSTQMQH